MQNLVEISLVDVEWVVAGQPDSRMNAEIEAIVVAAPVVVVDRTFLFVIVED